MNQTLEKYLAEVANYEVLTEKVLDEIDAQEMGGQEHSHESRHQSRVSATIDALTPWQRRKSSAIASPWGGHHGNTSTPKDSMSNPWRGSAFTETIHSRRGSSASNSPSNGKPAAGSIAASLAAARAALEISPREALPVRTSTDGASIASHAQGKGADTGPSISDIHLSGTQSSPTVSPVGIRDRGLPALAISTLTPIRTSYQTSEGICFQIILHLATRNNVFYTTQSDQVVANQH